MSKFSFIVILLILSCNSDVLSKKAPPPKKPSENQYNLIVDCGGLNKTLRNWETELKESGQSVTYEIYDSEIILIGTVVDNLIKKKNITKYQFKNNKLADGNEKLILERVLINDEITPGSEVCRKVAQMIEEESKRKEDKEREQALQPYIGNYQGNIKENGAESDKKGTIVITYIPKKLQTKNQSSELKVKITIDEDTYNSKSCTFDGSKINIIGVWNQLSATEIIFDGILTNGIYTGKYQIFDGYNIKSLYGVFKFVKN